MNLRLYVLQRLTAALMLPLIVGHLAIIFYATGNGLTAADILARTAGSLGWAIFYASFVVLVAIHAAIGFSTIAVEWFGASPVAGTTIRWIAGAVILVLGLRGVAAVTMPGSGL